MSSSYTLIFRGLIDDLDRASRHASEGSAPQAERERTTEVRQAFERLRQRLTWISQDASDAPAVDGDRTQDAADQAAQLELLDVREQARHGQHLFAPSHPQRLDAAAIPSRPDQGEAADVLLALALATVSLEARRLLASIRPEALAVLAGWPGIADVLPTTSTTTEGN